MGPGRVEGMEVGMVPVHEVCQVGHFEHNGKDIREGKMVG
jgi:hypothetical protein